MNVKSEKRRDATECRNEHGNVIATMLAGCAGVTVVSRASEARARSGIEPDASGVP
jgi:hypothetical protein